MTFGRSRRAKAPSGIRTRRGPAYGMALIVAAVTVSAVEPVAAENAKVAHHRAIDQRDHGFGAADSQWPQARAFAGSH